MSDKPVKCTSLSACLKQLTAFDGDRLSLNHCNLAELDQVPAAYTTVTKLHLSHNRLQSLEGLQQFGNLTHLSVAHNNLKGVEELVKVKHPQALVVLAVEGNPCALHPNLIPLVLKTFPHLGELDGVRINDHIRQDISDAFKVSSRLMRNFYVVEQEVIALDQAIKRIHIKHELLKKLKPKDGPYWEELNAINSREIMALRKPIQAPRYDSSRQVRAFMLLSLMEATADFPSATIDEGELRRLYKWMFCEVLLMLHSEGQHSLQKHLQLTASSDGEIDRVFQAQLYAFSLMAQVPSAEGHRADILPKQMTSPPPFKVAPRSFQDFTIEDLSWFPVFGCNSAYLRALMTILTKQIELVVSLQEERLNLLKTDYSAFGLPSVSEAERRLPRRMTPEISLTCSPHTTGQRQTVAVADSRDTERMMVGRLHRDEVYKPQLELTFSPKKERLWPYLPSIITKVERLQVTRTPSVSLLSPMKLSFEISAQTSEFLFPSPPPRPMSSLTAASTTPDLQQDPDEQQMLDFYRQFYSKSKASSQQKSILRRWKAFAAQQKQLRRVLSISTAYRARLCFMEWRRLYLEAFSATLGKAFEFRKHRMLTKPFKILQLNALRKRQATLVTRKRSPVRKQTDKLSECEYLLRRIMSPRHKLGKTDKENKGGRLKKTVKRVVRG
jgi:hypothetical protein